MVPEKKERRDLYEELECSVLGAGLSPEGDGLPGCVSHCSLCAHLCSGCISPPEPRDSTMYFVRGDAGAGRCPGAGTMQNMQEWD